MHFRNFDTTRPDPRWMDENGINSCCILKYPWNF